MNLTFLILLIVIIFASIYSADCPCKEKSDNIFTKNTDRTDDAFQVCASTYLFTVAAVGILGAII